MPEEIDPIPEYAPGEGYEPSPPPAAGLVLPGVQPAPRESDVSLSPKQFKAIPSAMIHDPEDKVGARCFDPGPEVKAEGKMVGLPCIRKRGHNPPHRSFQGEHPESRVFYEWT